MRSLMLTLVGVILGGCGSVGSPGPVVVHSDPTLATVEGAIPRLRDPLRRCYQRGLRQDRNLTGRVVVSAVVHDDGTVSVSEREGTHLANEEVRRCVLSVVGALRFDPRPGRKPETFTVPITFVRAPG